MADKPDQTDRQRLQEGVHQTDLTESRINEDFVDWLKTNGPTWLLVILIAVTAYLAIVRFSQHKVQKNYAAWEALAGAALPGSKVDVADEHADVFAVPDLALAGAGSQLLQSVQADRAIDQSAVPDPETGTVPEPTVTRLTPEERQDYLERADRMFVQALERDDGSRGRTLHAVQAINGRAAVAEALGRDEEARQLYEQAAARAGDWYPALAEQARTRAASMDNLAARIRFPETGAGPRPFIAPYSTATIAPGLRPLLVRPADQ